MSPGIDLYEDGEQVGVVDLDAETYEYDGEYEKLESMLDRMATEGIYVHPGETIRCEGVGLGEVLLRRIHDLPWSDLSGEADVDPVPVGFEVPEYSGYDDDYIETMRDAQQAVSSVTDRDADGNLVLTDLDADGDGTAAGDSESTEEPASNTD